MYSQYDLAKELGVNLETIQAFLEYLNSQGMLILAGYYPRAYSCTHNCSQCSGCKFSVANPSIEQISFIWELNKELPK